MDPTRITKRLGLVAKPKAFSVPLAIGGLTRPPAQKGICVMDWDTSEAAMASIAIRPMPQANPA